MPASAAAQSFANENNALVLRRVRIGVWLGALTLLAFVPVDFVRMPDVFVLATATRVIGAAFLFATLPLTRHQTAERFAVYLAAWVVFVLSTVIMGVMTLSEGPSDPAYLLQVVGIIFLILGGSLLVPVDGLQMFLLGFIPLFIHAAVSTQFFVEQNLPFVFASFVAVIIGTIGAHASYLTRFSEYERRLVKEQLLKAHEDFVAMISHDIRNPIAVIQGYATILQETEDLSDEDARDCLRRLDAAASTALLLANNVLFAARLESTQPKLQREPTPIDEVIDRALEAQRLLVSLKRIRLVRNVEREMPPLLVDAAQLERVFSNLLNNALKFTPEGGEVRVSAGRQNGTAKIAIEDDGDGIPPGCEESIFDRFTRASQRRDSTGLGLYISRSIVAAHHGNIHAENRANGGARFVVELPIS